jgi:hypothetical protein
MFSCHRRMCYLQVSTSLARRSRFPQVVSALVFFVPSDSIDQGGQCVVVGIQCLKFCVVALKAVKTQVNRKLMSLHLRNRTDRSYSSAITCRVRRFDPYTSRLSPVYHSSGQSFSAGIPFSGSPCSHCCTVSCHAHVPERRLRFEMTTPGIGDRLGALDFCGAGAEVVECISVP